MMEDYDVFGAEGLLFLSTLLRVLRQGIGSFFCFVLAVINPKIVTGKFLSLADLSEAQILSIHKLTKIIMVSKDEYLMFATF